MKNLKQTAESWNNYLARLDGDITDFDVVMLNVLQILTQEITSESMNELMIFHDKLKTIRDKEDGSQQAAVDFVEVAVELADVKICEEQPVLIPRAVHSRAGVVGCRWASHNGLRHEVDGACSSTSFYIAATEAWVDGEKYIRTSDNDFHHHSLVESEAE